MSFLKTDITAKEREHHPDDRLGRLSSIPNPIRNEAIAFVGEFCGTFSFLFMGFTAAQVAVSAIPANDKTPDTINLLFIAFTFGASLAVNAWAFFRISGGLFNPAVTLGLFLAGALKPIRAVLVFIAQILAGIAAAAVVDSLTPGPLTVSTKLAPGMSVARGLFLEMFLTAQLVLVIQMLAVEKHKATHLAPIAIGGALFIGHMAGVYWTGASLNPARSFGPEVIAGFQRYDWIYWLGPFLGAILASGFYRLMKFLEYETANPGQDFDDQEAALFNPPAEARTAADVRRPFIVAPADA